MRSPIALTFLALSVFSPALLPWPPVYSVVSPSRGAPMTITRRRVFHVRLARRRRLAFTGGPAAPGDRRAVRLRRCQGLSDPPPTRSSTPSGSPLTARGRRSTAPPETSSPFIGMPIGGICARTGLPRRRWQALALGCLQPPRPAPRADSSRPALRQARAPGLAATRGFGLSLSANGESSTRAFDASGWSDISFKGQYPIGTVEYKQPGLPVEGNWKPSRPSAAGAR